jgi:hypothetical protein
MAERAAEHSFWLQAWLELKLGEPLLMYMRKVIPKSQLRESLGAKVVFGRPVIHFCKLME